MKVLVLVSTVLCLLRCFCYAGRFGGARRMRENMIKNLKVGSKENCVFETYHPAGKQMTLDKIKAPVASLESQGLWAVFAVDDAEVESIIEKSSKTAEVSSPITDIAAKLKKLKSLINVGPTLGLFSTVVNAAFPDATPSGIIESTNKALTKMTNEVNKQFENMKGYVEQTVLNEKKQLLQSKLESIRIVLEHCSRNPDKAPECLNEQYVDITKEAPYFFLHEKDLKNSVILNNFEIHKLEAILVPAREYATLVILVHKTLIDSLNNSEDEEDKADEIYYTSKLKTSLENYLRYFENAIDAIKQEHNKNRCVGEDAIACEDEDSSWGLSNTVKSKICMCNFEEGSEQYCKIKMEENTDREKKSEGSYEEVYKDGAVDYLKEENVKWIQRYERQYREKGKNVISKYWAKQIGVFFQTYRKALDYTDKLLEELANR